MAAVPASAPVSAPPGVAQHLPEPPPTAAPDRQSTATKTIFGVSAPVIPESTPQKPMPAPDVQKSMRATMVGQAIVDAPLPGSNAASTSKYDRKTGARKTSVPAPEVIPPAGGASAAPLAAAPTADSGRATHHGFDQGGVSAAPEVMLTRPQPVQEERTQPTRVAPKKARGGSVWTYVGVGFLFGLALLGIYQLVGVLAH